MKKGANRFLLFAMIGFLFLTVGLMINVLSKLESFPYVSLLYIIPTIISIYLCYIKNKYAGIIGVIMGIILCISVFDGDSTDFIVGWLLISAGLNYTIESGILKK